MNNTTLKYINSLDIYLNYPAKVIILTECVEDVACGIYPCYYIRENNHIKVSTSVVALILDSKKFIKNKKFRPIFTKENASSKTNSLNRLIQKLILSLLWRTDKKAHDNYYLKIKQTSKPKFYYQTWHSIDKRIRKLKAFEKIAIHGSSISIKPTYTLKNTSLMVQKSAAYIKNFIQKVELQFPKHQHIILTSGKDSQLIVLTPKVNNQNWHIFSAEPNYLLVCKWLKDNGLVFENIFYHDNKNEETEIDIQTKIISGDLFAEATNLRWLPTLKKIALQFDKQCFFWTGTAADAIYTNHFDFINKKKHFFFTFHMQRVASWQGNYHQTFKNFVDCPLLSPYHSKEIWENVYQHFNPLLFKESFELRDLLGKILFGKEVHWLVENPSPSPYIYDNTIDYYTTYITYITEKLNFDCSKL